MTSKPVAVPSTKSPTNSNGNGANKKEISTSAVSAPSFNRQNSINYYDPEYAQMESWLDEHPEFVEEYFLRKASRHLVDNWLVSHATPTSAGGSNDLQSPTHAFFNSHPFQSSSAPTSAGPIRGQNMQTGVTQGGGSSSGATTPVRKISAHEFERVGLLKPIVNTIDGTPTFLSLNESDLDGTSQQLEGGDMASSLISQSENNLCLQQNQNQSGSGIVCHRSTSGSFSGGRPQRRSRNELKHLDEKELIFELVKDICNELDVRSLCHKILQNVSMLLHADRGSLFLVQGERTQGDTRDQTDSEPKYIPNNKSPVKVSFSDTCHLDRSSHNLSPLDSSTASQKVLTNCQNSCQNLAQFETDTEILARLLPPTKTMYGDQLVKKPSENSQAESIVVTKQSELNTVIIKTNNNLDLVTNKKISTSTADMKNINATGVVNSFKTLSNSIETNQVTVSNNHQEQSSSSSINVFSNSLEKLTNLTNVELISTVDTTISNSLNVNTKSNLVTTNSTYCGIGGRFLVSKLFDVCSRSTLTEMEKKDEIRIPWGTGIVGYVAESGQSVNIPDAYKDERFNQEIDALTGYKTKALLCMPIKDTNGDVIGVAQVINKQSDKCFTQQDEKVFAQYLQFCGIGLRNAQLYERSQLEVKRNQVLLDLARMIFEEQSTIEHMVHRILTHTQSLIQCQRVQVLLVHQPSKGSFSHVFDYPAPTNEFQANGQFDDPNCSLYESRFPINIGITGYVATTGQTVNIVDAYKDSRFDPSVDDGTGFKHNSILCMAIKNSCGQIIGVIQLVNKFNGLPFTKNDENFVEAFAIFCGMGIHNTNMYEKAVIAIAKQNVTLEVLSYHASATLEDAIKLRDRIVPSSAYFQLHDFKFDDIQLSDDETLKACLRMFLDLDLLERFHIDRTVLCRWLLSVKKNYRHVTYHNWRHAFNVAQMMFAILTATQWWKIFGEIECLALVIACLCHDLDHRGTNNSFQIKASSPLAQLYSTSTMEHHHFDQCLMILNSPGNQILSNVSTDEYSLIIKVLEDAILSTDLAVYFRKRSEFFDIVYEASNNGTIDNSQLWNTDERRELLRAMLMTICDLAAITKPWHVEKRVAELVSLEFFEQGDIERQELNITPIDLMNREKIDQLPLMQVGFIDSICLPIYSAFASLSDKLEPLVDGVKNNRQHWLDIATEKTSANEMMPLLNNIESKNEN